MRCGSSSTRLSTLQVPVKVPEVVAVAVSVGVGLVTVGVGVARVPGAGTRLGPGKRLSPMASGSALPHRRDERSRQDRGMGLARFSAVARSVRTTGHGAEYCRNSPPV